MTREFSASEPLTRVEQPFLLDRGELSRAVNRQVAGDAQHHQTRIRVVHEFIDLCVFLR